MAVRPNRAVMNFMEIGYAFWVVGALKKGWGSSMRRRFLGDGNILKLEI